MVPITNEPLGACYVPNSFKCCRQAFTNGGMSLPSHKLSNGTPNGAPLTFGSFACLGLGCFSTVFDRKKLMLSSTVSCKMQRKLEMKVIPASHADEMICNESKLRVEKDVER